MSEEQTITWKKQRELGRLKRIEREERGKLYAKKRRDAHKRHLAQKRQMKLKKQRRSALKRQQEKERDASEIKEIKQQAHRDAQLMVALKTFIKGSCVHAPTLWCPWRLFKRQFFDYLGRMSHKFDTGYYPADESKPSEQRYPPRKKIEYIFRTGPFYPSESFFIMVVQEAKYMNKSLKVNTKGNIPLMVGCDIWNNDIRGDYTFNRTQLRVPCTISDWTNPRIDNILCELLRGALRNGTHEECCEDGTPLVMEADGEMDTTWGQFVKKVIRVYKLKDRIYPAMYEVTPKENADYVCQCMSEHYNENALEPLTLRPIYTIV